MADVSRETPSEARGLPTVAGPEVARRVFRVERLTLAERYAGWLATAGVERGLIGPREVPRLWDRHLLNCAVVADLMPESAAVADVGSGAGLPGLVLAIARPDLRMTLIEPLLRRTTFLSEVVDDLGLDNVEVLRGKADVLHGRRTFDVVTSRAVAPLDRLLAWSMPLVAPSGALVAMKGGSAAAEVESAAETLTQLGCATPEVLTLGEGLVEDATSAVRVAWADPSRVSLRPVAQAPRSGPRQQRSRNRSGGKRR